MTTLDLFLLVLAVGVVVLIALMTAIYREDYNYLRNPRRRR